MTKAERNNVKSVYVERQNRELLAKSTLEQKVYAIAVEEQRNELARIDALKRQTDPERIATQQGTTVSQQKDELDRIAADKYAADIAKNNECVAQEQQRAAEIIAFEVIEASCCICFEENVQLLKKIPCKNVHSDHICGACLAASSVKTCPICRGPLTK